MKTEKISVLRLHFAFCILTSAFAAGCMTTGAIGYKIFGPTPVPAKFEPAKEPTLILVENYRSPMQGQVMASRITRQLVIDFNEHQIAPTIDPDKLAEVHDANPDAYRQMTIPAIARAVGAKQAVYVDLVSGGVERDSARQTARGSMAARVRVVDAATGDTLWPKDASGGYEVNLQTGYVAGTDDAMNRAAAKAVRDVSDQISKLFYKWKPDTQIESDKAQEE